MARHFVELDGRAEENLQRAATRLHMSVHQLLAELAGRVAVIDGQLRLGAPARGAPASVPQLRCGVLYLANRKKTPTRIIDLLQRLDAEAIRRSCGNDPSPIREALVDDVDILIVLWGLGRGRDNRLGLKLSSILGASDRIHARLIVIVQRRYLSTAPTADVCSELAPWLARPASVLTGHDDDDALNNAFEQLSEVLQRVVPGGAAALRHDRLTVSLDGLLSDGQDRLGGWRLTQLRPCTSAVAHKNDQGHRIIRNIIPDE
ncbi:hypothetical protein GT045_29585 [Streptomyces sp. SID486]|uniref:hypothetical protein n=1 Tax=Streptomyces sp. SID486 TaxID=2690264 RepID=UPI0013701BED|nr:hypothetical protein [Streptomyces sp. SID486]MYX98844.1 hypothetical protein [Streptomyces sp. SID486]